MERKEWLKLTSRPNVTEYVGCIEQLDGCRVITANTNEPIVRCRDCVHCYADDSVWMCAQLDFGIDYITSDEKPNGFCAWGERTVTG